MLAAAYLAVVLRFVSRRLMRNNFGVSFGMGKHSILIKRPVPFAQAVLTTEALYTPASTSIKFSVLLNSHENHDDQNSNSFNEKIDFFLEINFFELNNFTINCYIHIILE